MPSPNSAPTSGINSTAYRIFRLLQWLEEAPMTVETINERFVKDPRVQKKVSNDTLWLYLNTLRELGCKISRPVQSNGYHYELLYHPFGLQLDNEDLACLSQLKMLLEEYWNYEQLLQFDQLTCSILAVSNLANQEERLEEWFKQTRTIDYREKDPLISQLESACHHKQLLALSYESHTNNVKQWEVLALELTYRSGALYLLALHSDKPETMTFRLDRIKEVKVLHNKAALHFQLKQRLKHPFKAELRVFTNNPNEWRRLTDHEQLSLKPYPPLPSRQVLHVTLKTLDTFLLKQKLLECSLPYEVLSPSSLKEELEQELTAALAIYNEEVIEGFDGAQPASGESSFSPNKRGQK